jgi:hypothetical protein
MWFESTHVVHRSADGESNCHGKVSQARQRTQTEDVLDCLDSFLVARVDDSIDLVDEVGNPGNAVSRTVLHDGNVPFRVLEQCLNSGTAADTTSKDVVICLHGKGSMRTGQRTAVHDPWHGRVAESCVDAWECGVLSEIGVVGDSCCLSVCARESIMYRLLCSVVKNLSSSVVLVL